MTSHRKVVFPPPPPTSNELTAQQRAQLVRKTRKIEQILGTTPHFVDVGIEPPSPVHVSLPSTLPRRRLTKTPRSSIDFSSPDPSYGPFPSSARHSSLHRHSRSIGSGQSLSSSRASVSSLDTWPSNGKAPILRIASTLSTLDPVPASPSPTGTSFANSDSNSQSPSEFRRSRPISQFTISPPDIPTNRSSHSPTSFQLLSSNSVRKQKMDRIRKKLGHSVPIPIHLVFPEDEDSELSDYSPGPSSASTSPSLPPSPDLNEERPLLPPPTLRPRKNSGRISYSRDSISDSVTIHRAKRQTSAVGKTHITTARTDVKHRKSRSLPAPLDVTPAELERGNERLASIVESSEGPNVAGGLGGALKEDGEVKSGWFVASAGETSVQVWSSRKGSDRWLGAVQLGRGGEPSGPAMDALHVKRSPSYRKPVPTFPTG